MRKIKTLLQTVCVAFSLYSRIPMPRISWTPERMMEDGKAVLELF